MKPRAATLFAFLLVVLVAEIVGAEEPGRMGLRERLERHLEYRPDLAAYIPQPPDSGRTWRKVKRAEAGLIDEGGRTVENVPGYVLTYPSGEILEAKGTGRTSQPPPGTVYMTEHPVRDFKLTRWSVSEEGPLRIEFSTSPTQDEPGHYATSLTNVTEEPVRVERFGGFYPWLLWFVLNNAGGDFYSSLQFREWYGVKDEDGWIAPGETVVDYNNYGGPGTWWLYFGRSKSAEEFIVGAQVP